MKRLILIASTILLLSACVRTSTPTPIPTEIPLTPTATPVKIAPPPIQLGASYLYVDGATLAAVPSGTFIMGDPKGKDNPLHHLMSVFGGRS